LVLRGELGGRECGVGDLDDAEGVAAGAPPGEEVLVLLAAQRLEHHVETPVVAHDRRDLVGRQPRRGQLAGREEVEPGRASVHARAPFRFDDSHRRPDAASPPCRAAPRRFAIVTRDARAGSRGCRWPDVP
jgi:hypothetical protein